MTEEFMVSGYCRVLDGSRVLVCELTGAGETDTGCKYPNCDFAASCTLVKSALERGEEIRRKEQK